jgi:GT2 family glycosyltransferase
MVQLNDGKRFGKIRVKGKFLYRGNSKIFIRGVTYGTFAPNNTGIQFPSTAVISKDFAMMAGHGINCVRTYTVPSKELLDIAADNGLMVMIGLPWEQHVTFLDSSERQRDIIRRTKDGVLSCKGHSAILCYTIGNEIPAPLVRWYGKKKIEKFLKRLYLAVKEVDADALVTYVNYPTTEYLDLRFLDFDCFNVYLETPEKLGSYVSRLHNLAGDRPLVLAEIGVDSMRHGQEKQSEILQWQIETIFGKGCAGLFVFAWTDEWWRGGFEINNWDFGLVDRQRKPKSALIKVAAAMLSVPVKWQNHFPFISVVVCTYNGSATIRDTLNALGLLKYPRFEVIVVNDGSTDHTAEIVKEYDDFCLISTINHGLGNARNTGMYKAKGEIIAYIDDDAYPDLHWLNYMAYAYSNSSHAAMGGPSGIPEEDGPIAQCVANAPGGPTHVLETDEIAGHVPGCNLSIRKEVLMKIGGFDPVFRAAGDDVDICWRIQEAGHTIGFHPSVLVWHHRRNSIKAYWKQQIGYGKAEALLESKWPEKYNGFGHLTWTGRIYGNGLTVPIKTEKDKVFHGTWGTSLFQSVYQRADGLLNCIPMMPEYYLLTGMFGVFGVLGFWWQPLMWMWIAFAFGTCTIVAQAILSASKNVSLSKEQKQNGKYKALIVLMHMIQPVARLTGRIKHGLTPWRFRGVKANLEQITFLKPKTLTLWSETGWRSNESWLEEIEKNIISLKASVKRGGDFDKWDLKTRNGLFCTAKGLLTIEEHGANKQYLKFRCWVNYSISGILLIVFFAGLTTIAAKDASWLVMLVLLVFTIAIMVKYIYDSASVANCMVTAFDNLSKTKNSVENIVDEQEEPFYEPEPIRQMVLQDKI